MENPGAFLKERQRQVAGEVRGREEWKFLQLGVQKGGEREEDKGGGLEEGNGKGKERRRE